MLRGYIAGLVVAFSVAASLLMEPVKGQTPDLDLSADALEIIYPSSISPKDSQYLYDYELLRRALLRSQDKFGPFHLHASTVPMNQSRSEEEVIKRNGLLTIFARSTSTEKERIMLPIRIPINKGLISYRVFLIREQDKQLFSAVETLDDLQKLSVGSYSTWSDTEILRHGGFNVVVGESYEGLFRMLVAGRFDFFSRSVDEAYREYDERRRDLPTMAVEESLLLHFPTTRYFFVQRSPAGKQLAERVYSGLMSMIDDGSFDEFFYSSKGHLIAQAKLNKRKLIEIPNPYLSPETPLDRKELWFDPGLDSGNAISTPTTATN